MSLRLFTPLALLLLGLACQAPQVAPEKPPAAVLQAAPVREAALAAYSAEHPVSGELKSVGSDSMEPLMALWGEDFKKFHPRISTLFVCKGSGTAPKALIEGSTLMGQMSREMNEQELAAFQAKFGYAPTRIPVAVDALVVYVNANNPIRQLRMEEIDAIFSTTRKGGAKNDLLTWGDLGLGGDWKQRDIQAYGRDENSGTRAFFKEHVLKKGDFKPTVKALMDQFAVVEAPAVDGGGISYGPLQYANRMVKGVPVASFKSDRFIEPTLETIQKGTYPLTRFLYIYVNKAPGKALDPAVKEFLRFVLSKEGQAGVSSFGAVAVPGDFAAMSVGKLN
ncbi:PstS family phosphate ABC transporter substrate-binding protein [Geothrix sp. PMB-07]|uniref:PstS family phosphate ABC transporter substrate-binding protein n=1 Tax=Geothrix sp. PMB-07 TaxID=3068640 RepID=UPI002741C05D|nr:PstS family phosphate ABC transporter substrate-binding protein [Geothrix sp. PMB-07]WLT31383.1 PstS family phosphate ABC transporter substrate-binding protein [Geothrix sp. PMB-07]